MGSCLAWSRPPHLAPSARSPRRPPATRATSALGLLTSIVAGCVWITALSLTISLVVFIIGLPLIIGCAILFRWTAELDRRNTAWFLRRPVRARYREPGSGFMALLGSALRDPQTWRDLVWLVLHSVVGFVFGCIAIGLVLLVAGIATLPAWYWTLPDGADVGVWHADALLEAFALALLAIPTRRRDGPRAARHGDRREPPRGEPARRR